MTDQQGDRELDVRKDNARLAAVRKDAMLVSWDANDGRRTYAAIGKSGLRDLVRHLTGRELETFVPDERGLPQLTGLQIATPLHVYHGDLLIVERSRLLTIRKALVDVGYTCQKEDEDAAIYDGVEEGYSLEHSDECAVGLIDRLLGGASK